MSAATARDAMRRPRYPLRATARETARTMRLTTTAMMTRARDAGVVRNFFSQFGPVVEVRDRDARDATATTRARRLDVVSIWLEE